MKTLEREKDTEREYAGVLSPDHDSTSVISEDSTERVICVKCPLIKLENTLGQMSRAEVHSFYASCDPDFSTENRGCIERCLCYGENVLGLHTVTSDVSF